MKTKLHQPECRQCRQPMERGYGLDHTHGGVYRGSWAPGEPHESWWTGLKLDKAGRLPITMFRCPDCGRLESYAWPD